MTPVNVSERKTVMISLKDIEHRSEEVLKLFGVDFLDFENSQDLDGYDKDFKVHVFGYYYNDDDLFNLDEMSCRVEQEIPDTLHAEIEDIALDNEYWLYDV